MPCQRTRRARPWFWLAAVLAVSVVAGGCGEARVDGPVALRGPRLNERKRPEGPNAVRLASVSANVLKTNREVGPILRYLETKLQRRFELVYCRSYRDMQAAVTERRCELAWLSAQVYLALRPVTGCVPVVRYLRNGRADYRGLFVAGAGNGVDSLATSKGKRLALVDRNSTSGFAYPTAFFKSKGIVPERWFSSVVYAGSHENALLSVLRGLADTACIEEPVLERVARSVGPGGVRILAVTGQIPNGPIVAQADLTPRLREQIGRALVEMGQDTQGRRIVEGLERESEFSGFAHVTDADYDEVRRVLREAEAGP